MYFAVSGNKEVMLCQLLDLAGLNDYLVWQVRSHRFVASAVLSPRGPSDSQPAELMWRIFNPNRSPPLHYNYAVTVAKFEPDGIHLFDDLIVMAVRD
jgi:hypothetical protein